MPPMTFLLVHDIDRFEGADDAVVDTIAYKARIDMNFVPAGMEHLALFPFRVAPAVERTGLKALRIGAAP